MGLIFYLSSLSGQEVSKPFHLEPIPLIGHVVLFSGLAAFLQLAIRGWNFEINLRTVIAVAMASSLFGISMNITNHLLRGGMLASQMLQSIRLALLSLPL